MKHSTHWARWCGLVAGAILLGTSVPLRAQSNPLPSWNNGAAKAAIIEFVEATTATDSPGFVPVAERIATFDNDGTLWVEQPMYTQLVYILAQVPALVASNPALAGEEPFKTVLSGDREAMGKLGTADLLKLAMATLEGITVDEFRASVAAWFASAKDPRWKRPYTDLAYQPMLELLRYLRANGYKTYIVTGGGQDFVRVISERVYGIPPEQVMGSLGTTAYGYDAQGNPVLTKEPKLLFIDDGPGKAEGIHLMIGRRPHLAFGNSGGDRDMLEYTGAGGGARLSLLLLHDDAKREYAYGPARGLPDSKIGHFTAALDSEAAARGWTVVSMKQDWKRIFTFE
ncbi:MAG: haloacid dehalogenase-like hydrolase [Gemmatimonadales bacterium]|nr:MAG: haloacid dehalogenase-like hydrolase [Gemmatimonadales bacterium]